MNLVYKHTFPNNKSYIGKTSKSIDDRFKDHINMSLGGSETNFHRAIRKYGISNISSTILEENISDEDINEREIFWINKFKTFREGYNMTKGGDGGNTRIKMSKERYKEYCTNLSNALKGKPKSEEYKRKMSKIKLKNPTRLLGKDNPLTKIIEIYNDKDELVYISEGSFKDFCNEHNLPYATLNWSRKENKRVRTGKLKGWFSKVKGEIFLDLKEIKPIKYEIFDKDNIKIFEVRGSLVEFLKLMKFPLSPFKVALKNSGIIYENTRVNDEPKLIKTGNIKFKGWKIVKK